jgi:hypothetical protein
LTPDEFTVGEAGIMPPDLEAAEMSNWNTSLHIPEFKIGPENIYIQIRVRLYRETLKEYQNSKDGRY